jgi:hypothetical protein
MQIVKYSRNAPRAALAEIAFEHDSSTYAFASWNQLERWLKDVDSLRSAA